MKNSLLSVLTLFFLLSIFSSSKINAQSTTAVPPPEAATGTWQCIRGSERMQGTQYMKGSYANQPVVKWKANLNTVHGGCEGEPVIGDVNGDKKNDVVVTTGNGDVMAFDGATGTLLWDKAAVAGQTSPLIGDANGDSIPDVAVASDKVYLLDGTNGNIIWTFSPAIAGVVKIETSPNSADLDHDGKNEVVVICQDAIYAINGLNGTQKWKYATGNPITGAYNGSSPAIGDVNGDGILDVVAVLQNGSGNPSKLVAVNGANGALLWSINVQNGGLGLGAPVPSIGDVNGDCKMDVVYNKAALNGLDGSVIWGNPASSFGASWCILADLNNDCNVEVVTGCSVLKGVDGTTIWNRGICFNYGWFSPAPKVGDFDPNSPGKEIIMGESYQMHDSSGISVPVSNALPMTMYNGATGAVLWTYDLARLLGHTSEGISIGDIDNDGCVEIVIAPDCCNGDPTLLALDDNGNTSNCGMLTSISQVNFLPADTTGCNCANYRDFSTPCTNTWHWSFPGGSPSSSAQQNPGTVCYSTDGTFSVTMTAKINNCPADTVVHSITINCTSNLPPVAAFVSSDSTICTNDCIHFTDLSTNSPTSWLWTFQGGSPATSTDQNPSLVCYQTSGSFQVTLVASNSGGTDTIKVSSLINVIVSPPAPTITQYGDSLICSFDPSYTSYQWYDSAGAISGATNKYYIANHSGNFNVKVTNENGCSTATGINIVLGINNFSSDRSISLFPNPAHDQLIINGLIPNRNTSITIINTLGQIMQEELIKSNENLINVKDLSAGIYFIQITSQTNRWLMKFVKE